MLDYIIEHKSEILEVIGALYIGISALAYAFTQIAKLTPNITDDKIAEKINNILTKISTILSKIGLDLTTGKRK